MENATTFLVGALLVVLGYMIGFRERINLVHSYHYKRVAEADKKTFCKGVGMGNILVGIGILFFPEINALLGETVALVITGLLVLFGLGIAIATIVKYNKGLF